MNLWFIPWPAARAWGRGRSLSMADNTPLLTSPPINSICRFPLPQKCWDGFVWTSAAVVNRDACSAGSGLVMTAFAGSFLLCIKSFLLCTLSPGQGSISSKAVTHVMRSDEMNCPISLIVLCCYFNKTWENCHWNGCCTGGRFVIFFPVSHPDRWHGMRPCKRISIANKLTFSSSFP